ncbi:MAG: glutathione S-transferase [Woeseiaceae bacterium]
MNESLPIFYSFRRCPYAIRARLALKISAVDVVLREVKLSDKPHAMLACSPKGTVPVLQLSDKIIIEESKEIMLWALAKNDPEKWMANDVSVEQETNYLIDVNDNEFKQHLDHYKYADRFPEFSMQKYRKQGEEFLQKLEEKLSVTAFLLSDEMSLVDIAIFPFIRQFAYVDKDWFDVSEYEYLKKWLNYFLQSELFNSVMKKHKPWHEGDELVFL